MEEDFFGLLNGALWDVDLVLSVHQSDINGLVGDSLAVAIWVENIADSSSVSPWGIWNSDLLLIVRVGQGNEHITSGESVEVVEDVFLLEIVVERLGSLSGFVNSGGHLVDVRVGVHILPERFSVLWVVTTSVSLLGTIVIEWDTSGGKSKDEGVFEHLLVVVLVQESSVVVVIDEDTKGSWVSEFLVDLLNSSSNGLHGVVGTEDILDGVVHWVVENTGDEVLVWTNVVGVTVEALTHLEDTSGISVLLPEVLGDLRNGIDSNTIELVGVDQVLDPILKITSDVLIILVEIWEVSESAVLNLTLVVPVLDLASIVVMLVVVEWVDLGEVHADWGNVVGDNIDHDVHAFIVGSFDEVLKIISRTEVIVSLLPIGSPVTVITITVVINDWGDPDGVEAHTLDVVKVVGDTVPGTTAVVGEISTSSVVLTVALGESIGEDLIDGSLFPVISRSSHGGIGEGSSEQKFAEHCMCVNEDY